MNDDRLYLEHIRDAVEKILEYTRPGKQEFFKSSLVQDGVIRNFEIIGEATKRISEQTRRLRSDVPWSEMARFRDLLIHHYVAVDLARIWNVIENHLPQLREAVRQLLDDPPSEGGRS